MPERCVRREHHRAGDDQRLLIFLADLLPVLDVGEEGLVRLEILLFLDRGSLSGVAACGASPFGSAFDSLFPLCRPCLRRSWPAPPSLPARLVLGRDFHQRQHVGIDDAQLGLGAQLTAQQARRLEVAVDVVGAAGDEAGDEHALKRRHIELRLDRRLDRNLVVVRASRGQQDAATMLRILVVLAVLVSLRVVRSLISLNSS